MKRINTDTLIQLTRYVTVFISGHMLLRPVFAQEANEGSCGFTGMAGMAGMMVFLFFFSFVSEFAVRNTKFATAHEICHSGESLLMLFCDITPRIW